VRNLAITGVAHDARLNRVVNSAFDAVAIPPEGLVLSKTLADLLDAKVGSTLTLEVLEGARPTRSAVVSALVDDFLGTNAYMDEDALHRLMREDDVLSGAYLMVDQSELDRLYTRLKNTPRVAGVMLKQAAITSFNDTMGEMVGMIRFINILFASVIAFGVVYNSARIALSERSRELATLRVIGFTRVEISAILLGELAIVTTIAVPVGLVLGYGLAALMASMYDTEAWRMPLVVSPATYAFAALTVVIATVLSALVVRRKLDRLDLVEVLKTRE